MTRKEEIKKKINDNINQKKKFWSSSSLDKLDFLVNVVELEQNFNETTGAIVLRNSWSKKTIYLIMAIGGSFLIYMMITHFDFSNGWPWFIIALMAIGIISFYQKFFENKIILEINPEGLTLDNSIFNKWQAIEYLYFKTVYDGEGDFEGIYLVENLKIGYEHEIKINDLPLTTEELGRTLYHYMKKYGDN